MADSAAIKHHIPTVPRYGNSQGSSLTSKVNGIVVILGPPIDSQFRTHISSLDLPDVSSPTRGDGSAPSDLPRNCSLAVERWWPTPASMHPKDHCRQVRHRNASAPGCK